MQTRRSRLLDRLVVAYAGRPLTRRLLGGLLFLALISPVPLIVLVDDPLTRSILYFALVTVAAATVILLLDSLLKQMHRENIFLTSLGEGVAATDHDGRIRYINPAGASILHLAPREAIGRHWFEVASHVTDLQGRTIADDDRVFHRAMRGGETLTVNYRYVRADGTAFPAVATTAPLRHEGRIIGVINVFRDMTKEAELERERGELLSIASHQLKSPLTSMRWITEMLLRGDVGKLKDDQREQIGYLDESIQRLAGLVKDMLDVSRLEAGKLSVSPSETDLLALMKKAQGEILPLAKQKNQPLELTLPERLPKAAIDAKLIKEAVLNLLSNAVKYTPEGGRVSLTVERVDGGARVTVKDNGIGIPPEQQKDVFKKFFRADNAVDSGAEGTGLGLYVVKQIVELSGGKLEFVSEPGKGTSFFFTLPLAEK